MFEKSESKITFKDVTGIDECLEELQEIVDFLKDPEKFSKIGGKVPKGCILIGPPGTGKTLLSKAMAGEAGVPFFITSGSSFVEMFVGLGASRIRSLFEEAKKAAPCIIFIDEIDAIGKSRGGNGFGGGNDEREQTLNQLLVEMDGFSSDKGIIVVAATNRHEILDKALLRPGRFDRQIYVPIPDFNGRKAILQNHLQNIKYSSDVDVERIARGTPGFTGADLANLVNESALLAAKNNQKLVTMEDFEKSKDKLFLGKERKSLAMTTEEKKTIAYHEGGHALVSLFVKGADPVHKVTIIPRGRALGLVLNLPEKDNVLMSITQLKAKLAIAMGGRVAEELVFGVDNITSGASSDIVSATNIARKMVTEWGMSKKIGEINYSDDDSMGFRVTSKPNDIANLIEEEVKNLIVLARDEAIKILTKHRNKLDLIADTLLELETITGEHLNQILEDGKIKKKKKMKVVSKEVDALPIS
ncbi:ATP-dependent zinc metalloprotease FtsH-like [Triplophysa rosa]|uniref:ATP-dependent zinc metalloprotease FtsH-like n=1 Tax=Triplophysa rosa TaxID=992332 RepID=UPI002546350B|nr:ATP-dependent zinc metalloprotease FtsH-like [Triplophysa rosa]